MRKLLFLIFCLFYINANASWLENLGEIQNSSETRKSYIAGMLFGKSYGSYSIEEFPLLTNTKKFYEQNGYLSFWVLDNFDLNKNIFDMIGVIKKRADTPFKKKKYHVDSIMQILRDIKNNKLLKDKDKNLAICKLDILVTDSFFSIARDMYEGEIDFSTFKKDLLQQYEENDINHVWDMDKKIDYVALLYKFAKENSISKGLNNLEPKYRGFLELKKALKFYKEIEKKGGWKKIEGGGTLKLGVTSKRVPSLSKRLFLTKDLSSFNPNNTRYNKELKEAVKHFQKRHGIFKSGNVSWKTLEQLNIPVEQRIKKIKLNLERARYEKDSFDYNYVLVNIPEFKMRLVENNKTLFEMRIVVGSKKNPTPVFDANMSYMVVNPYWNVPQSIAKKEMLEKIQEDPEYLLVKNFKVYDSWNKDRQEIHPYDVDWYMYDKEDEQKLPFRFSKQPGASNPLGVMKFMFPNKYAVYMHDTPQKNLFNKTQRAFSHGCVRLQKPDKLLEYLSKNYLKQPHEEVKLILNSGENMSLSLKSQIPVYMRYYTAWVDDNGSVNFRNDIYKYDKVQEKLLFFDDKK